MSRIHLVDECDFLFLILDVTYVLIVLNPKEKMGYFKKHWPSDLQEEVQKCVEEEVCSCSLLLL